MSDSGKAVFLSYASQDAEAAKRICDALRAAGVEVWFDQSELVGGDAWDAKIKKQIRECALFVPIITPATNARAEGYFRREWKQAVERTHDMADDVPFLFPIVIGDVTDATARVPDKFREVQWTRLKLEETPGELAGRISRLLAGAVPEDRGQRTEDRPTRKSPGRWQWWMIFPIVGTVTGLMFAAAPLWRSIQGPPPKRQASTPDPKSPTPDPIPTEARQLAYKARALIDAIDSTADDYAAAESLVKRALELDGTDGEVWAVSSRVNSGYLSRGFDRDPSRRETARSQAERAVKLAPDSVEAWLALGRGIGQPDAARAEEAYRRGLSLAPNDGRLLLGLASLYRMQARLDEALALYEQAAARPESRALAFYDQYLIHFYSRRFPEADRCIREAIKAGGSTNMLAGLAWLEVTWHGDVAAAQRVLAEAPGGGRSQPRVVLATALTAMMAGQPDEALRAFDRLPADYINDGWYTGPKALLIGLAHHQAGRTEAARIAWESGLPVVRRRLQEAPNDTELHLRLGELLGWLGQTEAALQEVRVFNELQRGRLTDWTYSPVRIFAALGRADEALPLLDQLLKSPPSHRWPMTPALLKLDPLWVKIRADPAIQKLITDAEAAALATLPPRDWPKDPELKRAIVLIEGLESIPDDFSLAEEIAKQAVDRAPSDPEAAAVMARVQSQYMKRGFDRTDERAALARRYSERALQLAPDEPEAMYATACYLDSRGIDEARAERLLRRAMEIDPTTPRPGRELVDLFFGSNRLAEALAQGEANVRRFPKDVLSRYDLARQYKDQGRYEEFARELDATLAIAPLPNAIVWKARLQFGLYNDFAGMKTWLDRVPERVRVTERAVFGYFIYAAFGGQPEVGLDALRGFPQKWFTDFEYAGPTALLNACLLEMAGRTELARQQYEAALAEIQKMRATDPGRANLSNVEFWTLLGLGRKEEARASYRRMIEGTRRPYAQSLFTGWWFTPIPASLLLGERATALELLRECFATLPESRAAIRVRFQMDPRMAPFREDPEIKALLAEPAKQRAEDGGPSFAKATDGTQKTGISPEAKP